ncbi:MAG: ribosome silencing factor [Chitinispirillaceae bacterium]|nr:ribosome silencing factor [Chitinispirillaceae bacterium]
MSGTINKSLTGKRLVKVILAAAQEKLAERLTVIDLHGTSASSDFFIIVQSETAVQNIAIADAVVGHCSRLHTRPWHVEGEREGRWILLDFTDVVVHIMLPGLRSYYGLETLWTGGKRTDALPSEIPS